MYFNPMQPTLKKMAQRVLFDEKLASSVLPMLEVVHIWCPRAQWYCVYGMIETERQFEEHVKQGHKVRPIQFIELEGANHFVSLSLPLALVMFMLARLHLQVHWDVPEDFWAGTVNVIKN
jgi:hypothetical protein